MLRATLAGIAVMVAFGQIAVGAETWAQKLGYPAEKRVLILYADTMGVAYEFNQPGQELLAQGRIQAVGVMTPCPWFEEFAKWSRENPQHDVGICITLTSPSKVYRWSPLTGTDRKTSSLVDPDGYMWSSDLQLGLQADIEDVRREIDRQIQKARAAGIRPSHIHPFMGALFTREDLLAVYLETAEKNWIPAMIPELTPERIERIRSEGFPLSEEMIDLVQNYRLPKLDDTHFIPAADSYEETKKAFFELVKGLKPGLTQITAGPANHTPAIELMAQSWQQRVWENQLLSDKAVHDFLKAEGIIFTDWREVMERFENGGVQLQKKRNLPDPQKDFGINDKDANQKNEESPQVGISPSLPDLD